MSRPASHAATGNGCARPATPRSCRFLRVFASNQAVWCGLVLVLPGPFSVAAAPKLTDVFPRAVRPGETTEVTVYGTDLGDAKRIWTSFPARCEVLPDVVLSDVVAKSSNQSSTSDGASSNLTTPEEAAGFRCRFALPSEASIGIGAVRWVTRNGISPWLLLVVDDLPTVVESQSNRAIDSAQTVTTSVGIEGHVDPVGEDYYRFHADAGESLSFEVLAQRLGTPLDALLTLYDEQGQRIVSADDDASSGADCRLAYQFPKAGHYRVGIRDVRYRGGDEYRYRLRIGRFPLVSVAYPMGGRDGSVIDLEWIGRQMFGTRPQSVWVRRARWVTSDQQTVAFSPPGADGSGFVTIGVGPFEEELEVEPNDAPSQAHCIASLPRTLNGRLDRPGDVDTYRLSLKKGEQIEVRAESHRFGSAANVYLQMWNTDRELVGDAFGSAGDGPKLSHTADRDGEYRITVEDAQSVGGSDRVYRLTCERQLPGFSLTAESDTFNVPQGGALAVNVKVTRRDYSGPIDLRLAGLPVPVQFEECRIPSEKNETMLRAILPQTLTAGDSFHVQILGTAEVNGALATATASTLVTLRTQVADAIRIPRELDQQIAIGIQPELPEFFSLAVESGNAFYGEWTGQGVMRIHAQRLLKEFEDPITISVAGLPENCKVEVPPISRGTVQTEAKFSGPTELPPGDHILTVTGQGEFQRQIRRVVLAKIPLRVIPPLRVTCSDPEPLVPFEPRKVTVRVQRLSDERQPVTLQWKQGPPEILAPVRVVMPADKDEVEVTLLATAAMVAHEGPPLILTASTTVQGQSVVVDTDPVPYQIQSVPKEGAP